MGTTRHLVAFWFLGLINTIPYVIIMAGAKDIESGGVGIVYLCQILPGLMIQLTGPYWFGFVSYRVRIYVSALCMALSFATVVLGFNTSLTLQLFGVVVSGIQCCLGESSLVAFTSLYEVHLCLASWSSGSGFAGVAGFLWVELFTYLFDIQTAFLAALVFPVAYIYIFESAFGSQTSESLPLVQPQPKKSKLSLMEGIKVTSTLWPYMGPLILVYTAQYATESGPWSAIGFPLQDPQARIEFYRDAGTAYGLGVFVMRSTGGLFQIHRFGLMVLAICQVGLLCFFWFVAVNEIFYSWYLLIPCFLVGGIGGAVYVHALTLLAAEVSPQYLEFALAVASVSSSVGTITADVLGLTLQGCIYSIHHLKGAAVKISC